MKYYIFDKINDRWDLKFICFTKEGAKEYTDQTPELIAIGVDGLFKENMSVAMNPSKHFLNVNDISDVWNQIEEHEQLLRDEILMSYEDDDDGNF